MPTRIIQVTITQSQILLFFFSEELDFPPLLVCGNKICSASGSILLVCISSVVLCKYKDDKQSLSLANARDKLNLAMNEEELKSIARALVAPRKGILAADESFPTIKKRFDAIGGESSEEDRKAYRELLFTTVGIEEFISGVIMFDETLRLASLSQGKPAAKILEDKGIIPGIKVDKGAVPMPNFPDEKITEGLDGLRDRLAEYKNMGAKFTKWRAVITIG